MRDDGALAHRIVAAAAAFAARVMAIGRSPPHQQRASMLPRPAATTSSSGVSEGSASSNGAGHDSSGAGCVHLRFKRRKDPLAACACESQHARPPCARMARSVQGVVGTTSAHHEPLAQRWRAGAFVGARPRRPLGQQRQEHGAAHAAAEPVGQQQFHHHRSQEHGHPSSSSPCKRCMPARSHAECSPGAAAAGPQHLQGQRGSVVAGGHPIVAAFPGAVAAGAAAQPPDHPHAVPFLLPKRRPSPRAPRRRRAAGAAAGARALAGAQQAVAGRRAAGCGRRRGRAAGGGGRADAEPGGGVPASGAPRGELDHCCSGQFAVALAPA